jgi:hypothetical protein
MKITFSSFTVFAVLFWAAATAFAQQTFDPANPTTSANPPTELYNEYTGTLATITLPPGVPANNSLYVTVTDPQALLPNIPRFYRLNISIP